MVFFEKSFWKKVAALLAAILVINSLPSFGVETDLAAKAAEGDGPCLVNKNEDVITEIDLKTFAGDDYLKFKHGSYGGRINDLQSGIVSAGYTGQEYINLSFRSIFNTAVAGQINPVSTYEGLIVGAYHVVFECDCGVNHSLNFRVTDSTVAVQGSVFHTNTEYTLSEFLNNTDNVSAVKWGSYDGTDIFSNGSIKSENAGSNTVFVKFEGETYGHYAGTVAFKKTNPTASDIGFTLDSVGDGGAIDVDKAYALTVTNNTGFDDIPITSVSFTAPEGAGHTTALSSDDYPTYDSENGKITTKATGSGWVKVVVTFTPTSDYENETPFTRSAEFEASKRTFGLGVVLISGDVDEYNGELELDYTDAKEYTLDIDGYGDLPKTPTKTYSIGATNTCGASLDGNKLTVTGAGTVDINYTLECAGYETVKQSCTVKINPIAQSTVLKFNNTPVTSGGERSISFDAAHEFTLEGTPAEATVQWSLANTSGTPITNVTDASSISGYAINGLGTYRVTAKVTAPGYTEMTLTYDITVNAATQDDYNVHVEENSTTVTSAKYADGKEYKLAYDALPSGTSLARVNVTKNNETTDEVSVNLSTGVITIGGVGTYRIEAVFNRTGYNEASYSTSFTVENGEFDVSGSSFAKSDDTAVGTTSITYDKSTTYKLKAVYYNAADATDTTGTASYEVTDENGGTTEVASIDDAGVITINKAGKFIAKVTVTRDNFDNGEWNTGVITVNKADRVLSFDGSHADNDTLTVTNSSASIAGWTASCTAATLDSCQDITYSMTNNNSIATINASTGAITLEVPKTGSETVTVTIPACDHFNEATLTYTLTVQGLTPVPSPIIQGESGNNGWYKYKSGVTTKIVPAADTKIAESAIPAQWLEEIALPDGAAVSKTLYVYDPTADKISANAVNMGPYKVDTVAPSSGSVTLDETAVSTILDSLTFHIFRRSTTVTLSATDATSGIAKFTWWTDEADKHDEIIQIPTTGARSVKVTVAGDVASELKFTVEDVAGNVSEVFTTASSSYAIIVDSTDPVVNVSLPDSDTGYYTADVDPIISINEKWIDFSTITVTDVADATLNNAKTVPSSLQTDLRVAGNWTKASDSDTYTFNARADKAFTETGDYKFKISVADKAGNTAESSPVTLKVDKTPAVTYTSATNTVPKASSDDAVISLITGGTYYHNGNVKFVWAITESNYDEGTLTWTVKKNGTVVATESTAGQTICATAKVDYDTTTNTFTLGNNGDGVYELTAQYTDVANNQISFVAEKVVVDTTNPEYNIQIDELSETAANDTTYYVKGEKATLILTANDDYLHPQSSAPFSVGTVLSVTGKDLQGNGLAGFTDGAQVVTFDATAGNSYEAVFELSRSGIYTVTAHTLYDYVGNGSGDAVVATIVVDDSVPTVDEIRVSAAADPINVAGIDYYTGTVNVAVDVTSTFNPITSLSASFENIVHEAVSATGLATPVITQSATDKTKFTITYTLTKDMIGEKPVYMSVVASPDSDKGNASESREYSKPFAIDDTTPAITVASNISGGTGEVGSAAVVYTENAEVGITITESNLLTTIGGYKPVVKLYEAEYDTDSAVGTYKWKEPVTVTATWTESDSGIFRASVLLNTDGLYYLTVDVKDPLDRTATLTTKNIRINKTAPVITVTPAKVASTTNLVAANGFNYYDGAVDVTVEITEEGFNPANVSIAFDGSFTGSTHAYTEAATGSFNTALQTAANWTRKAGTNHTYVTVLHFTEEKQYNFTITAENLGGSSTTATAVDFVIDKTAPELDNSADAKLPAAGAAGVAHSESAISGTDLEGNAFTGYAYNGVVKFVTTLTDENVKFANSVIDGLTYKVFLNGAQLSTPASVATVTAVKDSYDTFTITFAIDDATEGVYSVEATYTDVFRNSTSYESDKVLVDTTAPVSTISYNGNLLSANPSTPYIFGTKETVTFTVTDDFLTGNTAASMTNAVNPKVTISAVDIKGTEVIAEAPVSLNWTLTGNVWSADYTVTENGIYTIKVEAVDAATNTAEVQTRSFTVDDSEAGVKSIAISQTKDTTFDGVDLYKADSIEVVATVESDSSEVTELTWKMTQRRPGQGTDTIISDTVKKGDAGVSFVREAGSNITTVTFTISADTLEQFAGMLSATAKTTAKAGTTYVTYANTFAVDNVAPVGAVSAIIAGGNGDIAAEPVIFNGSATATFTITEANFKAIVGENPNTAIKAMLYTAVADATTAELSWDEGEEVALTWSSNGSANTASYTISADGNYYMTLEYTDPVGHEMTSITTKTILVDTVNPVMNFEVTGGTTSAGDTQYHQAAVNVVVTVVEKNFYPSGVTVNITGENAAGGGVGGNFGAALNWTHNGDIHTASITLAENAIYSISGSVTDLAGRSSTGGVSTKHAVDNVAPAGLNVAYSTSILDQILEQISFGFYKAPVTVTVSATDETSGVTAFEYSYLKASNVSGINGQAEKIRIDEGSIAYGNGRQAASATFQVPNDGGQFNGTVSVTATDRAGNSSEFADSKRVVVDNIAPTAEVTYNAPVSDGNGIKYFDTAITANIRIKEANFFRDDVHVSVSRNNGAFAPETVSWSDGADDMHTASLTLAEEGQYRLNIEYADKSTNEMTAYQSDLMIVDTIVPVMTIDSVKSNVAYADDTVGFVITVSDENLEESSFNPSVSGWVKENGSFTQKSFTAEGTQAVSDGGKTITYTIANLPADGIYTVTSSVADKANHYVDKMTSTAQDNAEVDSVRFSVNRVGSTYGILDEATKNLIGNFKNYADVKDVVVTETNPTALSNISVTLYRDEQTLKLDESSFELSVDHKEGEWYEYTYRVKRENFKEDGVYSVSFYSEDEAGHQSENTLETKNTVITFGVDSTVPTLIVANLENDETYDATEYVVTMQASDNLGLTKVLAKIENKTVGEWTSDGEGDAALSSNDEYEFTIQESSETQKVVIELTDKAGNKTTGEFDVLVTTNTMVRFVNNKPLVYGTVGGVAGVGIVTPIVVVAAKKKGEFILFKLIRKLFGK